MSQKTDWDEVSYVIRSTPREFVIKSLCEGPKTPGEIRDETEIDIAHISRGVTQLQERGLTELLVDENTKKGRLYGLTDEGQEVAEAVESR